MCVLCVCMYSSGPFGFGECVGKWMVGQLTAKYAACGGHQIYGIGVQMLQVCMVLAPWTALSVLKGIMVAGT